MEQQHSNHSVVEPLSMPKMKLSGDKAASLNAFALSFAAFFGFTAIFAAIAGFTRGEWQFQVPFIGLILSNITLQGLLITSLLALAFGIIGLLTMKQLTDKAQVTRSWSVVSRVFLILAVIAGVSMVAIALYSLMGAGLKDPKGATQKAFWLSNFIPNLIVGVAATGIYFAAKQIAAGKLALLRMFSMVAIGIASIGFIVVIVQTLVGFYGDKKSSSSSNSYDYSDILDYFYN